MFNVKTLLRHAVLALALAGSSLAAMAAPVSCHVDVNTSTLTGNGFLDLQFGALLSAPAATVTFSNFTGALGAVDYVEGDVVFNADGSITLGNRPGPVSLLSYNALFGGAFGFDLAFSDDFSDDFSGAAGTDGGTLTVGLLDTDFGSLGGGAWIARFELTARHLTAAVAANETHRSAQGGWCFFYGGSSDRQQPGPGQGRLAGAVVFRGSAAHGAEAERFGVAVDNTQALAVFGLAVRRRDTV